MNLEDDAIILVVEDCDTKTEKEYDETEDEDPSLKIPENNKKHDPSNFGDIIHIKEEPHIETEEPLVPYQGHDLDEVVSNKRSMVAELRKQNKAIIKNEKSLIKVLGEAMANVEPPSPPRNYFTVNSNMLQCVYCGAMSESIPAASRHYQDKHGPRYLVCFACGDTFRRVLMGLPRYCSASGMFAECRVDCFYTTIRKRCTSLGCRLQASCNTILSVFANSKPNLYRHEKRCKAPDAPIVLRARAIHLRTIGRCRPGVPKLHKPKQPKTTRFACSKCVAIFTSRKNLEGHENLHRGERPYRCHVCPNAYTSYTGLYRHSKKHSNEQYICDHCGRSFKVRGALVTHMKTHRPLRQYACTECDRRFAKKVSLQLHINSVHRNLPLPYACHMCPKRLPRLSHLRQHMIKMHGVTIVTRKMLFQKIPTLSESELRETFASNMDLILKYSDIKKEEP